VEKKIAVNLLKTTLHFNPFPSLQLYNTQNLKGISPKIFFSSCFYSGEEGGIRRWLKKTEEIIR
jgi:hypothetical protein